MDRISDYFHDILTAPGKDLSELEAGARMIIVYVAAVIIVRLGKKRFMAENTAFDVIIGIMLGSILSRAINGAAQLGPSLVAGVVLVAMHWILSWLAFHSHLFGKWVKGNQQRLVVDGQLQRDQMKESHITENDLKEALRLQAQTEKLDDVALATLERSGEISVIEAARKPRVLEVQVQDGVQTVRLEIA